MGNQPTLIVFDVETTGTDRKRDQVIELCIQFGLDDPKRNRVWRVKPETAISPGAQEVHGISMEDLADCPSFGEIADEIRAIFEAASIWVGYNLRFDIEMIQAEFQRIGQRLDAREKQIVDPFRLWQQCEPRSLQEAHRRFVGNTFEAAHSASADVAATGRVLEGMLSAFGLEAQNWQSIAQVCEPERASWVGPSPHFRWNKDGVAVIGFGKHSKKPLHELATGEDSGYFRWILSTDFPPHVREISAQALELETGEFQKWVRTRYAPIVARATDDVSNRRAKGTNAEDRNNLTGEEPQAIAAAT